MKNHVVKVWEVYQEQECIAYLTEEEARNSTFFELPDLIAEATVRVSENDLERLNAGLPIFLNWQSAPNMGEY